MSGPRPAMNRLRRGSTNEGLRARHLATDSHLTTVRHPAPISTSTNLLHQIPGWPSLQGVHGLGVAAAEGLAEWHHQHIRTELALEEGRGKRYSFGYSACPDLADQQKLFALLQPEERIGVTLTTGFQLVPEASTSALIVHHPQAMYYMVRE